MGRISAGVSRVLASPQLENKGDVKAVVNEFIQSVHFAVADSRDGAPRPSNVHSKLQGWEHSFEANAQAGILDFAMVPELGCPPR